MMSDFRERIERRIETLLSQMQPETEPARITRIDVAVNMACDAQEEELSSRELPYLEYLKSRQTQINIQITDLLDCVQNRIAFLRGICELIGKEEVKSSGGRA